MGYVHIIEIKNIKELSDSNLKDINNKVNSFFQDILKCIVPELETDLEVGNLYELALLGKEGKIDINTDVDYDNNFEYIYPYEIIIVQFNKDNKIEFIKTNRKRYDIAVVLAIKYLEYLIEKEGYNKKVELIILSDGDIQNGPKLLNKDKLIDWLKGYLIKEIGLGNDEEINYYNFNCIEKTIEKYSN